MLPAKAPSFPLMSATLPPISPKQVNLFQMRQLRQKCTMTICHVSTGLTISPPKVSAISNFAKLELENGFSDKHSVFSMSPENAIQATFSQKKWKTHGCGLQIQTIFSVGNVSLSGGQCCHCSINFLLKFFAYSSSSTSLRSTHTIIRPLGHSS